MPNFSAYFYTEIAVSPNNNVVNIYEKKGKDWVKIHELTEHSGRITGTVTYISQLWLKERFDVICGHVELENGTQ